MRSFEPPYLLSPAGHRKRPRKDSNLRTRFRKPMLYPLSYGGLLAGFSSLPDPLCLSSFKHSHHHPSCAPSARHPKEGWAIGETREALEVAKSR